MKKFVTKLVLGAACFGLVIPQQALLAAPPAAKTVQASEVAIDVALDAQGAFVGQLVDAQGQAVDGAEVVLRSGSEVAARTVTNNEGKFTVTGLKTGTYVAHAANGQAVFRVWDAKVAPPAARAEGVMVAGHQVVRGQPLGGDFITIALLGVVITDLIYDIQTNNDLDDLQDESNALRSQLNNVQDQLDAIQASL